MNRYAHMYTLDSLEAVPVRWQAIGDGYERWLRAMATKRWLQVMATSDGLAQFAWRK